MLDILSKFRRVEHSGCEYTGHSLWRHEPWALRQDRYGGMQCRSRWTLFRGEAEVGWYDTAIHRGGNFRAWLLELLCQN